MSVKAFRWWWPLRYDTYRRGKAISHLHFAFWPTERPARPGGFSGSCCPWQVWSMIFASFCVVRIFHKHSRYWFLRKAEGLQQWWMDHYQPFVQIPQEIWQKTSQKFQSWIEFTRFGQRDFQFWGSAVKGLDNQNSIGWKTFYSHPFRR